MGKTISKRDMFVKRKISGWDNVIADAQRHITRLKAAIRHAEDMKQSGEPWPSTSNAKSAA